MGVFGDWAGKYFDLGINVVPIDSNKTPPKGFTYKKWLTEKQTEEDIERLVSEYGHKPGVAVICGAVSGIVGFDFDYKYKEEAMPKDITFKKYEKDFISIEDQLKRYLPGWVLAKKAKHGWTSFYKYSPDHKSVACDRYGVRLFDFKASGYVVVPPSHHSFQEGVDVTYSWICGDPMDDFLNLPDLSFEVIRDFRECFSHRAKGGSIGGRHGELFKFACDLVRVELDDSVIAQKMIKYDLFKNGAEEKGPYFRDKNHVKGDALSHAVSWASRIRSFVDSKPKKESGPIGQSAWDHFFSTALGEVKKDILSGHLFARKTKKHDWDMALNLEEVLRAYAKPLGLGRSDLRSEFARFCYEEEKLDFLCEFKKWDFKTDYVSQMTDALKSDLFSAAEISDIFKNWGTSIFDRIENSTRQNRCIIIQGEQGKGKDTWIENFLTAFSPYYERVMPPTYNKDWQEVVSRLYVCHIEEFDQTAKVDVSFLKGLITQPSVFFRESYGRAPTKKKTPVSFISSVNPTDFFRDTTGNRRFLVIPITGIDFGYPKDLSPFIIGQLREMHRKDGVYKLSGELEEKIKTYITSLTPESVEVSIEELWLEYASRNVLMNQAAKINQATALDIFYDISRKLQISPAKVRRTLKSKGYQYRDASMRYWANIVPKWINGNMVQ